MEEESLIGRLFNGTIRKLGVVATTVEEHNLSTRLWGGGETADAADLKSAGVIPRVGSNPTRPTQYLRGTTVRPV